MNRNFSLRALLIALCGLAGLLAAIEPAQARPAWRGEWGGGFNADQQPKETVRERQRVPLRDVVRKIMARRGGQFLDAEMVPGGSGGALYLIKWVTDDGRRIDFVVDAETGRIIDSRGE